MSTSSIENQAVQAISDLPYPPAVTYSPSEFKKVYYRTRIAAIVSFVILVGVIIFISVAHKNDESREKNVHPKIFFSDPKIRHEHIHSMLVNFSDPLLFFYPDSPQSRALSYLVMQGNEWDATNAHLLAQRYAVLVLFYSCGNAAAEEFVMNPYQYKSECDLPYFNCSDAGEITKARLKSKQLSGQLPEELRLLSKLQSLDLRSNFLRGTIPEVVLSNFKDMAFFNVEDNQLFGTISSLYGRMSGLRELFLTSNQFTGTIPAALAQLEQLYGFSVRSNLLLTGPMLETALHWRNISLLDLRMTALSGTIPTAIGQLTTLVQFHLAKTEINGTIPTELMALTKLETLFLSNTELEGSIPWNIGNLRHTKEIEIGGKKIIGDIPPSLGQLTHLVSLSIIDTGMNGTIPATLGDCTALTQLNFELSQFSGTVPTELEALTKLQRMYLSSNPLNGSIPLGMCRPSLQIFRPCSISCDCCALRCEV